MSGEKKRVFREKIEKNTEPGSEGSGGQPGGLQKRQAFCVPGFQKGLILERFLLTLPVQSRPFGFHRG